MAAENPGEPGPDLRDQDLASPQEVLRYLSAIMEAFPKRGKQGRWMNLQRLLSCWAAFRMENM